MASSLSAANVFKITQTIPFNRWRSALTQASLAMQSPVQGRAHTHVKWKILWLRHSQILSHPLEPSALSHFWKHLHDCFSLLLAPSLWNSQPLGFSQKDIWFRVAQADVLSNRRKTHSPLLCCSPNTRLAASMPSPQVSRRQTLSPPEIVTVSFQV